MPQITCPSVLGGFCQIMDQGIAEVSCGVIGIIQQDMMYKNSNGECAFKPTATTEVTSIGDCVTVTAGERDGDYMLILFGRGPQDLNNPSFYNAGSPRNALRTNK